MWERRTLVSSVEIREALTIEDCTGERNVGAGAVTVARGDHLKESRIMV